jgi:hypothetical protein
MQIVNFFYELAKQHEQVRGFRYGKPGDKGAGRDAYPLVWLDDPILGQATGTGATVQYTANVDFLGIPANEAEVPTVQAAMLLIGLDFVERIKQVRQTSGFSTERFSFITLRQYTDDDAAGVRFTFGINQANPVNRCAENFDPSKVFPTVQALPAFDVDAADGCAVFTDKKGLPNFTV